MKVLMVTPYPPLRDGIASYAVQTVVALRAEGHTVEVLSPGPSAAHQHLELPSFRGALALAKRVRGYDRLIVQYHPDFFFPIGAGAVQRAEIAAALTVAFHRAPFVEVRLHEIDYRTGRGHGPVAVAMRRMWSQVDSIVVHSTGEKQDFVNAFRVKPKRVVLADHGQDFQRYTFADRTSARRTLNIPADVKVFLAIGFIQPHKGFDRAVRAFARVATADARLYVVGSLRVDDAEFEAYRDDLRDLIERTPGTQLREGYVSDELFDRWLVAADCLVMPYRSIWSSGVLERARLYGVPVIATDVGGLRDQASRASEVLVVSNDHELAGAIAGRLAGQAATSAAPGPSAPWPDGGPELRIRLQDEIGRRAISVRGGPLGAVDVPVSTGALQSSTQDATRAIARLTPVPVFALPPTAGSGMRAYIKKVMRRLTGWESREVANQLNRQKVGTDKMVAVLAAQVSQLQERVAELEASRDR